MSGATTAIIIAAVAVFLCGLVGAVVYCTKKNKRQKQGSRRGGKMKVMNFRRKGYGQEWGLDWMAVDGRMVLHRGEGVDERYIYTEGDEVYWFVDKSEEELNAMMKGLAMALRFRKGNRESGDESSATTHNEQHLIQLSPGPQQPTCAIPIPEEDDNETIYSDPDVSSTVVDPHAVIAMKMSTARQATLMEQQKVLQGRLDALGITINHECIRVFDDPVARLPEDTRVELFDEIKELAGFSELLENTDIVTTIYEKLTAEGVTEDSMQDKATEQFQEALEDTAFQNQLISRAIELTLIPIPLAVVERLTTDISDSFYQFGAMEEAKEQEEEKV
eukprot:TRINITY_DN185_c6_g1_i1.p1 TRINITY_DN185_c6_g1~~TRINITY_DN185_c6_g1_i1.p1  ORF type:complete len:352 (+),score=75.41 TRINITY_DN185_c6_g1_i1:59-1057(+)